MTAAQASPLPDGPDDLDQQDSGPSRVQLSFTPSGKQIRVPAGVAVFDAASWNGIPIDSTCGGHGTCKKCKVRVVEGAVPVQRLDIRAFDADQLADGWRLACIALANTDLTVDVPPLTTRPKAATVGVGRQVILRPALQKRYVELVEPTLSDQRTDVQRVLDELDDLELKVDPQVHRMLGRTLRSSDFKVTAVVVDDELVAVESGDTTGRLFGLAFDLGTTTVVGNLMDISTGTPIAVASMLNKQQPFGADVISRISATMLDADALARLQSLAHETLNELASEACAEAGVELGEIYEVALAGNATMVQLALGIDPEPLGVAPFILASAAYQNLRASDLGVDVNPQARATVISALGAYVGGDIISGVLATGMDRDPRIRLFIDIGTNCEIVIGDGERLLATAAPAGPAFEAASIRCGMRAAPGAIEVVKVTDDGLDLQVIGDVAPTGMCGSGLVDAVSELVRARLIDGSGRFVTEDAARDIHPILAPRFVTLDKERVFLLATADETGGEQVYLSQRDVRELQFAKAAISTGWRLLLEEFGIQEADIQQVLLAGSFGTYLSAASAVRIGLVPKLPLLRIVSAGNVAGEGAKMILLSAQERHGAKTLIDEIEYVELSDRADFNDRFIEQLGFPV
ncbi:MAG TPA: ASKHA domain-containing protein [Actinomycetes bacterium]|nr:ASKHA domain-containing protein [Actinomycetes bacterium]